MPRLPTALGLGLTLALALATLLSHPTHALRYDQYCQQLGSASSDPRVGCNADPCLWGPGYLQSSCASRSYCQYRTSTFPACFLAARSKDVAGSCASAKGSSCKQCDVRNLQTKDPNPSGYVANDIVLNNFVFFPGVYMAEGTSRLIMYNLNLLECAQACMDRNNRAAPLPPGEPTPASDVSRCLSMNFYAFESVRTDGNLDESCDAGVCVLNSQNTETARLRFEDQGYTDAELFIKNHNLLERPKDYVSGYYELRQPRGGQISQLLDVNVLRFNDQNQLQCDINDPVCQGFQDLSNIYDISTVWAQSVWGVAFLQSGTYDDRKLATRAQCGTADGSVAPTLPAIPGDDFPDTVQVAYVPFDDRQQCPGPLSWDNTAALCSRTGGRMCKNREMARVRKLQMGCGFATLLPSPQYQNDPLFSHVQELKLSGLRYPHCCGDMALTNVPKNTFCDNLVNNIDRCSAIKSRTDCTKYGSGTSLIMRYGDGRLLDEIRSRCLAGTGPCKGPITVPGLTGWVPRDSCVWCSDSTGVEGQCRPGSSYGICTAAQNTTKRFFATNVKGLCGTGAVCKLFHKYPDLGDTFNMPPPAGYTQNTKCKTDPNQQGCK